MGTAKFGPAALTERGRESPGPVDDAEGGLFRQAFSHGAAALGLSGLAKGASLTACDGMQVTEEATTDGRGLFLWAGTMRTASIEERARGMLAGGMREMSAFPIDVKRALEAGSSYDGIRAGLGAEGTRISVLDPLAQWLPGWERPAGLSAEDAAFYDFDEEEFFRMAESLGVDSVTVIEPYGRDVPVEAGAEAFARVCERAAGLGMRVHLEFIPFTGIKDLRTGWEIVRLADRPNGGLVFDVWHYFLGKPDEPLLRTIPGEKIFVVQVSDAAAGDRGTVEDFYRRLAPGEGVFDLKGVLRALDDIGGLSSVGPEIFSEKYDSMPPEEAGRRAEAAIRAVLDEALGGAP